MNVRELPDRERPREKLLRRGRESLSNAELLAVLLRTGTRSMPVMDLAAKILSRDSRGLRFLAECTPEELQEIGGMGTAKSCELLAAVELGRRIAASRTESRGVIESAEDVIDLFMEKMRYHKKEHFVCLLIGSRGEIIEETEVSVGDLNSAVANPREVFTGAVRRSAGAVLFLHNHPSGDPSPSEQDILTTRRLERAGMILGIPVVDHIIIGDGTYTSLKAEGLMMDAGAGSSEE